MSDGVKSELDLSEAFREAFRLHPAGVAILSTDLAGQPIAVTVSSLISVSAQPPTVAFSLSATSSSAAAIRQAGTLVIHFLRLDDVPLADLCASRGAERFGPGINWTRLPSGEPRYTDVGVWFRARIVAETEVAGAVLMAAELLEGQVAKAATKPEMTSLVYLNRHWHGVRPQVTQPAHSPVPYHLIDDQWT